MDIDIGFDIMIYAEGFSTFYWFMVAYYNVCYETLLERYEQFVEWMRDYFEKKGAIPTWITDDSFKFFAQYFRDFKTKEEWREAVLGSRVVEEFENKELTFCSREKAHDIVKAFYGK